MSTQLKKHKTAFLGLISILCFASCQKIIQYQKYDIVAGTIYIKQANLTDAVIYNTLPGKDSVINVTFEAAIADQPSAYKHTVTFKVDPSKMAQYTSEHGNATLLPASNYQVVKSICQMPAGAAQSESASIKLLHTSQIAMESNYVLPVVIQDVDGRTDALRPGQVLFIVFTQTPDPKNFKIASFSSDNGTNVIANVLAANPALYWRSATNSTVPQNFVVNMGAAYPISGINFTDGPDYVTSGGNGSPKNMEVDVSTDGITWVTAGTYTGLLPTANLQTVQFALTTVQYFRVIVTATNTTSNSTSSKYVELSNISMVYPKQ